MPPSVDDVRDALRVVMDPDLGRDVVSLGFVHDVAVDGGRVGFTLQLTTPACPAKDALREAARTAVAALPGVDEVRVRMTARTSGGLPGGTLDALSGVKNVVAVMSGKGGVGKSTVAVNLALALHDAGARVGLVDLDVHGPSVQHLTGAPPPDTAEEGAPPPQVDGVSVLSMAMFVPRRRPTLLRGPRVTAIVQQFLGAFDWGDLDYLIVDTPPGTGDVHITLAQAVPVTGAVLVTTPQETAVADSRRSVAMLQQLRVPILGVVETMAGFVCPSCDVLHPVFGEGGGEALAAEAGEPLLGRIPLDPAVVAGGERARPVVRDAPESPAGAAFRALAGRVAAELSIRHATAGEALDGFRLRWDRTDG